MSELKLNPTCIPLLDHFLQGGIPAYSLNVVAGLPGAGKTIFVQNLVFNYLKKHPGATALYFSTISEPTLKIVRYLSTFSFFDADIFGERVFYFDLHEYVVKHTLNAVSDFIWKKVEEKEPSLLVIDSFKAISDMVRNEPAFRLFCYNLSMRLATSRCTSFLVGEYSRRDMEQDSEFAVADGIFYLDRSTDKVIRNLEVHKLRGQKVSLAPLPYTISSEGIRILGWGYNLEAEEKQPLGLGKKEKTNISGLDKILEGGFRKGQGVLISGTSGSGKTSFSLNLAYHYALQGKKVVYYSFEEAPEVFEGFLAQVGLDYGQVKDNLVFKHRYLSQLVLEEEMLNLQEILTGKEVDVLFVDSLSMLLHSVKDSSEIRTFCYYLQKCLYEQGKLGFFTSDIHFGRNDLSRSGVEETIFDVVIHLSLSNGSGLRKHFLEVYKYRGGYAKKGIFRWTLAENKGLRIFDFTVPLRLPAPPQNKFFLSQWTISYPRLIVAKIESKLPGLQVGAKFLAEGLENGEDIYLLGFFEEEDRVKQDLSSFGLPDSAQLKFLGPLYRFNQDPEVLCFELLKCLNEQNKPARVFIPLLSEMFSLSRAWLKWLNPFLQSKGVVLWINFLSEQKLALWPGLADLVLSVKKRTENLILKNLDREETLELSS